MKDALILTREDLVESRKMARMSVITESDFNLAVGIAFNMRDMVLFCDDDHYLVLKNRNQWPKVGSIFCVSEVERDYSCHFYPGRSVMYKGVVVRILNRTVIAGQSPLSYKTLYTLYETNGSDSFIIHNFVDENELSIMRKA